MAMSPENSAVPPRRKTTLAEYLGERAIAWTGSSWAFGAALAVLAVWAITGPIFDYSDTWQLAVNTLTSVVTFLMVFLIQRAQNKESMAVQLKLNEIVSSLDGASDRLIDIERLSEAEIHELHARYQRISARPRGEPAPPLPGSTITTDANTPPGGAKAPAAGASTTISTPAPNAPVAAP